MQVLDFVPALATSMISMGLKKAIDQLEKFHGIQKFNKKGSLFSKWKKRVATEKKMPEILTNAVDKLGKCFA